MDVAYSEPKSCCPATVIGFKAHNPTKPSIS